MASAVSAGLLYERRQGVGKVVTPIDSPVYYEYQWP